VAFIFLSFWSPQHTWTNCVGSPRRTINHINDWYNILRHIIIRKSVERRTRATAAVYARWLYTNLYEKTKSAKRLYLYTSILLHSTTRVLGSTVYIACTVHEVYVVLFYIIYVRRVIIRQNECMRPAGEAQYSVSCSVQYILWYIYKLYSAVYCALW